MISKVYIKEEFGNTFLKAEYENATTSKSICYDTDDDLAKLKRCIEERLLKNKSDKGINK